MTNVDNLLDEQIAYYRARAGEYDEWFLRQGRYDRGPEMTARWFAQVDEVRQALDAFGPTGDVLEIACGTGLWTQHLIATAASVTAVDSSPEVIAINADRVGSDNVKYIRANLWDWQPERQYDVVFFSFWLSHVPPSRFDEFWQLVGRCLKPDGRVFLIDSQADPTSKSMDHPPRQNGLGVELRRLNDGSEYNVVKIFYDPRELTEQLSSLGWSATLQTTASYFLFGSATVTTAIDSIAP